jgi:glutamyl-tRNA synthetase
MTPIQNQKSKIKNRVVQNPRGRFAPSPTGLIHLGNVWTALLAWLDARQRGGAFVLRMEDLDPDRSRPHYAEQLLHDLRWLGLDWNEGPDVGGPYAPYEQDRRRESYAAALERLIARGLVYRCYCTRAEVRAAASAPHGNAGHESCPNQCARLVEAEQRARQSSGRRPCLRVRMPDEPVMVEFEDLSRGLIREDVTQAAGDFVIRRADGVHAYQLAVVVDDGAMEITHVIRGADLLDSTARQIWLHQLLGYTPPRFGHVPLLVDRDGHRLSKRHAALAIAELRAAGRRPTEIIGSLAHWAGLTPAIEEVQPRDLIGLLDWTHLPRHDIVIDVDSWRVEHDS